MLSVSLLLFALASPVGQSAPSESDAPRPVGGRIQEPRRVKGPAPRYPEAARRAGLAGIVVLECTIAPKGVVSHVAVRSGARMLADAAVEAVREWGYTPTLLDGVAVPVIMTVTVNFKMESVSYEDLIRSLRHEEDEIRVAAARNLRGVRRSFAGKSEMRDAIDALEALAEKDPSPRVRAFAAESLAALDGRPLPPIKVEPPPSAGPAAPAEPAPSEATTTDGGARSVAWGTFVDPLGQCGIVENDGRLEISVPAGAFELTTAPGAIGRETGSEPAKPGGPLTDFDSPPRVRKQVKPEYPREAFEARIQGTVLVEALVDEKGHIAKARVIQSVPGLDEAALDVARKWRFEPAMKNGKPVATIIHMPVSFRIGDQ